MCDEVPCHCDDSFPSLILKELSSIPPLIDSLSLDIDEEKDERCICSECSCPCEKNLEEQQSICICSQCSCQCLKELSNEKTTEVCR